jgi:hypothetical protein
MKMMSLAFLISLLAGATPAMSAPPTGPTADFLIHDEYTLKSPDGATMVEQFARTDKDGNFLWQFWAHRSDTMTLLGPEQQDYSADFRFTRDSRWMVRLQKTGSGEGTMFLYRLGPTGFVSSTSKPFGDLAWAYFRSRPESRKVRKPEFHVNAYLVADDDDNDQRTDAGRLDNRYLTIALSGEIEPNGRHGQVRTVRGWLCRYDLETGKFDVPKDFAEDNKEALASK